MKKGKVVLLDTSAIIYRAFYANPHFRTKNEPTGAIYGFTLILQKIIKEFNPEMIGAAFDVSRSSLKRTEYYSEYKAQRDAAPEDLIAQIGRIEELLDYYNIKKFKVPQHEADDVLGTLAKILSNEGHEVIIITGDKDLSQVISNNKNIKIALLGKGDGKDPFKILSTEEDVVGTLGVRPCEIPDFFGLIGDTSDGIPGVRKIGPKKAVAMLEIYKNLEGIYDNIDKLVEIPGVGKSLVTNIIEDKELAFTSRHLATIDENLEELQNVEGKDLCYEEDEVKLLELFKTLEFKAMIKKYSGAQSEVGYKEGNNENYKNENYKNDNSKNDNSKNDNSKNANSDNVDSDNVDFERLNTDSNGIQDRKLIANLRIDFDKYKKIVVDSQDKFEELLNEISGKDDGVIYLNDMGCVVVTEHGEYFFPNIKEKVLGEKEGNIVFSNTQLFSMNGDANIFKDSRNYSGNNSGQDQGQGQNREQDQKREQQWLRQLFQNIKRVVGYNIKTLYQLELDLKKVEVFDTLIGYHLLTSTTKGEFEVYSRDFVGVPLDTYKETFPKRKIEDLNSAEIFSFLAKRGRVLFESYKILESKIKDENLVTVMNEVEIPLIEILAQIEIAGIKIDEAHFRNLNIEFSELLNKVTDKIYLEAGLGVKKEFNLNSPKQLAEVLFVDLSLPILKKNKTGPSTDVDVLEELSRQGIQIADLILEHRKLTKLVQTYVEPLPKLADKNGRIHSSFNQIGTTTGRLSSSNPNLQNIPVKSHEGIRIRKGFVANKGKKLIGIDYSQIELRVLAELSQDENLVLAYKEGLDLHDLTARKIFELTDTDLVSREQRTIAKIINFSLIYGKTAFGLSKELKIPQKDAAAYIKAYFEQYPKVKVFEKEIIEFCEDNGYVKTLFGRKRWIDGINSRNRNLKMQAERMAVNTVVQGTAAEILKKAMINIHKEIKDATDIKMILQVHDELIFEVDENKAPMYKEKLEKLMKEAITFHYSKLDVNGVTGDNWAEIK